MATSSPRRLWLWLIPLGILAAGVAYWLLRWSGDDDSVDDPSPLEAPAAASASRPTMSLPAIDIAALIDVVPFEISPASPIYYVAPDGDDTAAGGITTPWRTVQKAADTLAPGETVYIRQGVYNEAVTVNVSGSEVEGPITFSAFPGETAVLDGSGLEVPAGRAALVLIADKSWLLIKDLEIRGYVSAEVGRMPIGIFVHGTSDHIQIVGNRVHHIETLAAPRGADLLGADAHGIAVYGDSAASPITHLLLDSNEVYNLKLGSSESVVINGNVDTFAVINNVVHDNDNIGLDFIGFEGVSPDDTLDQARNGLVAGNLVYNIDTASNPAYSGEQNAGGIYVDGGTQIIIEANTVYNSNIGIELASEHGGRATSQITLRSNFIHHNHMTGIAMGGYDKQRGRTEGCLVLNNTLFHNDTLQDGNGELLLQFDTRGNLFKNNILVANSQGLLMSNPYRQIDNLFDSNIYYAAEPDAAEWEWQGEKHAGFASFQRASGVDPASQFIDPGLLDPALPDLHLAPGSPAIDAGEYLPQSGSADIDGGPRQTGTAIDIGAHEYSD